MPRLHASMHWWPLFCLSVCLSVPYLILSRERKGVTKLKIDRKESRYTG